MKTILRILLAVYIFTLPVFSQQEEAQSLNRIYQSLEYNTIAFDDMKEKWVLNDPILVREIYNKFVVRDAFRLEGKKVTVDLIKEKSKDIYEGTVVIDLRRRYYDDEVEHFAFVPEAEVHKENPKYLFDPIRDGFLLKDILGDKLYEKIKTQSYFYSNITKTDYNTKNGYFFDLYLNLLEPKVMFWNTTSSGRNKYLLSVFGKWGNDYLLNPGWYSGDYTGGVALTYYENISSDLQKYTYDVRFGTAVTSGFPFISELKNKERLAVTGQSVYGRISGEFLKYVFDGAEDYILTVEGKTTLDEFPIKEFGPTKIDTIYSARDYGLLHVRKRFLYDLGDFGWFEAGAGIGTTSSYKYKVDPSSTSLVDLEKNKGFFNKFEHNIFVEAGVVRTGGLIQHNVNLMLSYTTEGFGAFGAKAQVMLSDQIGFDLRVMKGFGLDEKKMPWRTDSYIVFSPIFRINY